MVKQALEPSSTPRGSWEAQYQNMGELKCVIFLRLELLV